MDNLLTELLALRDKKAQINDELKAVNAKIEEVNKELTDIFLNKDIQNIKKLGRTFYLHSTTDPQITDQSALIDWLEKNGDLENLMMFNTRGFKAYYRELEGNNEELPPMVKPYIITEIRVR